MNDSRVKINFYKWLILTASLVTLILGVEYSYGILSSFASMDMTGICYLIWMVGIGAAAWAGVVSCRPNPHMMRIKFLGSLCQVLGLLGTVIGMLFGLKLNSLAGLNVEDKVAITDTMVSIATSISTCLTTTATGIIFSVMISLYPFLIKDYSERR